MARLARTVFAGVPHHVVQRGNRREDVFFADADRRAYLGWLAEYAKVADVDVIAYCLMTNHIHLVAVPAAADGLQRLLKPLHTRYALRVNRTRGSAGHVWQGRFFSSALDDVHLWAAIRYVERNPVRAGMVRRAEDHPWSSASAHCGLRADPVLTQSRAWRDRLAAIDDWSGWLAEDVEATQVDLLRRHLDSGLPCGSDAFVSGLEAIAGRSLRYRPRGRPRKAAIEPALGR
ncbi:MAG: transposase [Inquilinus sp.]|nr:transposase [Inquilinus sp.]